jgi:hypothetical protein
MQIQKLLPLVLALGVLGGCDQSEVGAAAGDSMKSAGDALKGAAQQAGASLDGLMKDLEKNLATLDTTKLQEHGKTAMAWIAAQLEAVKDLPSAQKVAGAVTPLLEKLEGVKTALGDKLPDVAEVKSAISSLKAKFQDSEVMQALEPMLAKLESLIG